MKTREYEAQSQARITAVQKNMSSKKTDLVLPGNDIRRQQPHAHSACLFEQQRSRICSESLATSPATVQKRRENHSHKSDARQIGIKYKSLKIHPSRIF